MSVQITSVSAKFTIDIDRETLHAFKTANVVSDERYNNQVHLHTTTPEGRALVIQLLCDLANAFEASEL
jgi:hypothetical protein